MFLYYLSSAFLTDSPYCVSVTCLPLHLIQVYALCLDYTNKFDQWHDIID